MAASHMKALPVLRDEDDYLNWKNDLEVWRLFTDADKKKMGLAVYLTLTGRARETVRELKPSDLAKDDGLDIIVKKLDAVYLKDENTRAYIAFKEFYEFKRASGEHFTEFIVKYEHLYHRLFQHKMDLPEGVQAFFLLNAANVAEDNEKLARTTVGELCYVNMKQTLMRIFGDPIAMGEDTKVPAIKEEVFYSRYQRGRFRGRGRYNFRGRCGTDSRSSDFQQETLVNIE